MVNWMVIREYFETMTKIEDINHMRFMYFRNEKKIFNAFRFKKSQF